MTTTDHARMNPLEGVFLTALVSAALLAAIFVWVIL